MKKYKGQVIVEFAIVLPLFLLVLFGIIYSGMLFYDYSSLSNLARSAAREAAITQSLDETTRNKIQSDYSGFITGTSEKNRLLTSLYAPDSSNPFTVTYNSTEKSVGVTITMKRNTASALMQMVLPEEYRIEYYMKRDEQSG